MTQETQKTVQAMEDYILAAFLAQARSGLREASGYSSQGGCGG